MSEAARDPSSPAPRNDAAPWLQRLAERRRSSPLRLAIALAFALATLLLLAEFATGRLASLLDPTETPATRGARVDFRIALVLILLFAWLSAAYAHFALGARRTMEERALRAARAALAEGRPSARSLADLVAWRNTVLAVHEWPLDAPTLRRFTLYLAIPFGSWLGGALVEHVVDSALR